MHLTYAPALRDEDIRRLEDDLLEVADSLGASDVDIAAAPGRAPMLDFFYADGRADDAALRAVAEKLVAAFNARPVPRGRPRVTLLLPRDS
jgi:hypothetical protein